MNIVEFKSTIDYLLHIILYVITTGIAVGGLITVVCLYMLCDRRATQKRQRKTASTPAPLTEN